LNLEKNRPSEGGFLISWLWARRRSLCFLHVRVANFQARRLAIDKLKYIRSGMVIFTRKYGMMIGSTHEQNGHPRFVLWFVKLNKRQPFEKTQWAWLILFGVDNLEWLSFFISDLRSINFNTCGGRHE
jgi:hypothetical protein